MAWIGLLRWLRWVGFDVLEAFACMAHKIRWDGMDGLHELDGLEGWHGLNGMDVMDGFEWMALSSHRSDAGLASLPSDDRRP